MTDTVKDCLHQDLSLAHLNAHDSEIEKVPTLVTILPLKILY